MIREAKKYLETADEFDKLRIYMDYYIHNMYNPYALEFVDKDYVIPKGYENRIKKFNNYVIKFLDTKSMSFEQFQLKQEGYHSDKPIVEHLWRFYKRIGVELIDESVTESWIK